MSPRRRILGIAAVATGLVLAVASAGGATTAASSAGVVEIRTTYGPSGGSGAGTGMVLTSAGEVLTNNHVIRGATLIRVHVPATGRSYRANVLGYSIAADVALLKLVGASRLETVALGNSATVDVGDSVTAVGNAGGSGLSARDGRVTARGVTITVGDGLRGTVRLSRLIETSADLRQGDSGGPLFDAAERVIGVNAAATSGTGGDSDGYAIPINRATSIVTRIRIDDGGGGVHVGPTPFLGILVAPSAPERPRGIVLAGVRAGSPAAVAGLGRGDVIVSLNGTVLRTSSQLVDLLLRFRPGDTVRLVWVDDVRGRTTTRVTLVSGPPQ